MKLKQNLEISTDDFYYDLFEGGYLNPEEMLISKDDVFAVVNARKIIENFKKSCEQQIEDFYR